MGVLLGLTVLTCLFVFGAMNVARGLRMGGDSRWYDAQSDLVVAAFHGQEQVNPTGTAQHSDALYRGFWYFVAFFKIAFHSHWQMAFLIGVALVYSLGCGGLFLTGCLYDNRRWIVGLALYCALVPSFHPEVFFLGNYLLSDVSLGGLCSLTFSWIAFSFFRNKISLAGVCVSAVFLSLLLVWKPTMISVVVTSLLIILARLISCRVPSSRLFRIGFALYLVGSIVVLVLGALLIRTPDLCPFESARFIFYKAQGVFNHGSLLDETTYWTVSPPHTPWEYIQLALFRYVYVFRYWNPLHSSSHQLYAHLYFAPVLLLAITHLVRLAVDWPRVSLFQRWVVVYGLMVIHSLAVSCAISVTAWEFRYQIPMFFFLWLFAFFGFVGFLRPFPSSPQKPA